MKSLLLIFSLSFLSSVAVAGLIHEATEEGDLQAVQELVYRGVDVNSLGIRRDRDRPLHIASLFGHFEIAKLLLANGAIADAQTVKGYTPLHIASFSGHSEIVKLLIANGADMHMKTRYGQTALHYSLVNASVNSNFSWNLGPSSRNLSIETAKFLIENGANVNAEDDAGDTPLHTASKGKSLDLIKLLVENGANINKTNSFVLSLARPLNYAIIIGSTDIIEYLVNNGAKLNLFFNAIEFIREIKRYNALVEYPKSKDAK